MLYMVWVHVVHSSPHNSIHCQWYLSPQGSSSTLGVCGQQVLDFTLDVTETIHALIPTSAHEVTLAEPDEDDDYDEDNEVLGHAPPDFLVELTPTESRLQVGTSPDDGRRRQCSPVTRSRNG